MGCHGATSMHTRREFVSAALAVGICAFFRSGNAVARADKSFDSLYQETLGRTKNLDATRTVREGLSEEYNYHATRAIAPRDAPSGRAISDDAVNRNYFCRNKRLASTVSRSTR